MNNIKYGVVTTEEPDEQNENRTKIITDGYYEGNKRSSKVTIREDLITSRKTLLADTIKGLELLKSLTPEVTIRVVKDKYGNPNRISYTWIEHKERKN